MKSSVRQDILTLILKNQGINYTALRKLIRDKCKNLAYHLLKMENDDEIVSVKNGKYRHCFTWGFPEHKMWLRIYEQYPMPSKIILFLKDNFKATNQTLANICETSSPTISYHLTRMTKSGVVKSERIDGNKLFSLVLIEAGN